MFTIYSKNFKESDLVCNTEWPIEQRNDLNSMRQALLEHALSCGERGYLAKHGLLLMSCSPQGIMRYENDDAYKEWMEANPTETETAV